jgi:hypothetical protein
MPLIDIIIYLVVIGVLLWLINSFVPMAASIKSILNLVVVVVVVLWLLRVFGIIPGSAAPPISLHVPPP